MLNHEGLVRPDIVPVTQITDDQITTIVRTRRYETEPLVLHRPDTIDEQDTDAIAQLTTNRLTAIKEADPYLSTDFEPYTFAPSKYATSRAEIDAGLHYDRLEALVAHVTLAGSCTADFLADNGAPYKGPRTLSISTIERPYRIEEAWAGGLVDPSVTDNKVYRTTANIGTMILFLTHRFVKPNGLPQGFWHDFKSTTEDRTSKSTLFSRKAPHS